MHQNNLGLVGQSAALDDVSRATCKAFIRDLYPAVKKQTSSADELRYVMFCQKQQKSELLPPTSDSVLQHAKRVSYRAFIWRNALVARPHLPFPEGNGWEKINSILQPCYMTKAAAPSSLLELTMCKCKKSGCQSDCLVSTSDCLALKLVVAWQTWTCAKIHMVHSWTQAMNLRTILTVRLIK